MMHLAGTPVRVGHLIVQRCLLCGYRMDFIDLRRVMIQDTESDRGYATFTVGGIYEVTGNCTALVAQTDVPEIDGELYPELCIHSMEIT